MDKQVLHRVAELATAGYLAQGREITKCRASLAPVCVPAPADSSDRLVKLLTLIFDVPRNTPDILR